MKFRSIIISTTLLATFATACQDDIDDIKESYALSRALSPTNIEYVVKETPATSADGMYSYIFKWNAMNDAASYTIEVAQDDDLAFANIIGQQSGLEEAGCILKFANEDHYYHVRVKSLGFDGTTSLYTEYDSVDVTKYYDALSIKASNKTRESALISWSGSESETVTSYTINGGSKVKFDIETLETNAITVAGLSENTDYSVELFSNRTSRGKVSFTTRSSKEIEAFDAASFKAAIDSLDDGVVILVNDIDLDTAKPYFSKNVTIQSEEGNQYTITMTAQWEIGPGEEGAPVEFDYIKIQNVNFHCTGNYLFNCASSDYFTLGLLSFDNCQIDFDSNNGRSIIRTQGSTDTHTFKAVSMNNCVVNNCQQSGQNYAAFHFQTKSKAGQPAQLDITNSTFNQTSALIMLRVDGADDTTPTTVNISDCTFYGLGAADNRNPRYYIDLNYGKSTAADELNITNCIFGATVTDGGVLAGVRKFSGSAYVVTESGNFVTSDHITTTYKEADGVQTTHSDALPGTATGASTDVFTDPQNGDFSIKNGLKAGDPRWYE